MKTRPSFGFRSDRFVLHIRRRKYMNGRDMLTKFM